MNAKEINTSFDLVAYVSQIVTLKKSGAYWISQDGCPICKQGRDRFQIKQYPDGAYGWMCRKCHADKYGSVIDFLMAYHNEDFKAALKRAGGDLEAPRRELGKPVTPPAPVQVLPSEDWQHKAWAFVDRASDRLLKEPEGEPGRRYLLARGISQAMIQSQLLGFAVIGQRPAIAIPWLDLGDVVSAIKYRFIDELASTESRNRFAMMTGSMPYLFGCRDILESDKTLLFCEGELNAISIMQTRPRGVSVISAGSEGNGNAALLRALGRHYQKIVIWTDDPAKGKTVRERMNRPEARLLKSPFIDGVKYDANEMLQRGLLMDFISAELATVCQGVLMDKDVIAYMGARVSA